MVHGETLKTNPQLLLSWLIKKYIIFKINLCDIGATKARKKYLLFKLTITALIVFNIILKSSEFFDLIVDEDVFLKIHFFDILVSMK